MMDRRGTKKVVGYNIMMWYNFTTIFLSPLSSAHSYRFSCMWGVANGETFLYAVGYHSLPRPTCIGCYISYLFVSVGRKLYHAIHPTTAFSSYNELFSFPTNGSFRSYPSYCIVSYILPLLSSSYLIVPHHSQIIFICPTSYPIILSYLFVPSYHSAPLFSHPT